MRRINPQCDRGLFYRQSSGSHLWNPVRVDEYPFVCGIVALRDVAPYLIAQESGGLGEFQVGVAPFPQTV